MVHEDRLPDAFRRARDDFVRAAMDKKREEIGAPRMVKAAPWTCPHCGHTSEPFDAFEGIPRLSKPTSCECIDAAETEARGRWEADELPILLRHEWIRNSGVPRRYRDATLENFEPRTGATRAHKRCRAYADAFERGTTEDGLVLMGPWGSGKTHLAIATARAIHDRLAASVHFTGTGQLISESRDFQRAAIDKAIRAGLLILDDIGQEHMTEWARSVVYEVLDTRYQNGAPTILTTNLDTDGLREWLGAAPVSRLHECAEFVPVTASDYRAEIAKRKRSAA